MRFKFYLLSLLWVTFLSACGGHNLAPKVTDVSTSFVSPGIVKLTAQAVDNVGVTGYCFTTSSVQPTPSDACFQDSNEKQISLSTPQQRYYVWARDAVGHVSSAPKVGPCSSAGFTASDDSSLSTVCMMTSLGELVLGLDATKAPLTVANFLKYVNDGFYTSTAFHRVIANFMVQGGGFTWSSEGGFVPKSPTHDAIAMELPSATKLSNVSGTISMARTADLNSATSQFFINVVDNTSFDTDATPYAVFGSVISGNNTLSALKSVSVVDNGSGEMSSPANPPLIQWAIQLK